jgi:hypothetical protein
VPTFAVPSSIPVPFAVLASHEELRPEGMKRLLQPAACFDVATEAAR